MKNGTLRDVFKYIIIYRKLKGNKIKDEDANFG